MSETRAKPPVVGWVVFLFIAISGLLYVKWLPCRDFAFVAAANHSIVSSI